MANRKRKPHRESVMFRTYVLAILIVLVGTYGAYRLFTRGEEAPPKFATAELAQCITDSGAKLYGTFWCPHCTEQKKMFGDAIELIDYTECTVDGKRDSMNPDCTEANITSLPTWIFGDGTRMSGAVELDELANRTGCPWGPGETTLESTRVDE